MNTYGDNLILALSILVLIFAVFICFFWLDSQVWYIRGTLFIVGLTISLALGLMSKPGKNLIAFAQNSYREVNKVIWPTRKETLQITLVVFIFVLVIAIYIWACDKLIEWVIFSVILGWK
ncbi:MAG: preprotein translocase subunit SecE [Burkholderia sp.]|nr:preprotein translocase subunit SecE [Burkholderia sp.]